tara:strand:- start:448 stop:621 length:174 start_codon:yes stop_codon:yes gene_type:complete
MIKFFPDFTQEDYALIVCALRQKQASYVVGDRMYKEYGDLIKEMNRRSMSAIARRTE